MHFLNFKSSLLLATFQGPLQPFASVFHHDDTDQLLLEHLYTFVHS